MPHADAPESLPSAPAAPGADYRAAADAQRQAMLAQLREQEHAYRTQGQQRSDDAARAAELLRTAMAARIGQHYNDYQQMTDEQHDQHHVDQEQRATHVAQLRHEFRAAQDRMRREWLHLRALLHARRTGQSLPAPAPADPPITEPLPAPVPAPADPLPEPDALPSAVPAPVPAPADLPSAEPALEPEPVPAPAPADPPITAPLPAPLPAPADLPSTAPAPADPPSTAPLPAPAPADLPITEAARAPVPAPADLPSAEPALEPEPADLPSTAPAPTPAPAPLPAPVPADLPSAEPALEPEPAPAPAPAPLPEPALVETEAFLAELAREMSSDTPGAPDTPAEPDTHAWDVEHEVAAFVRALEQWDTPPGPASEPVPEPDAAPVPEPASEPDADMTAEIDAFLAALEQVEQGEPTIQAIRLGGQPSRELAAAPNPERDLAAAPPTPQQLSQVRMQTYAQISRVGVLVRRCAAARWHITPQQLSQVYQAGQQLDACVDRLLTALDLAFRTVADHERPEFETHLRDLLRNVETLLDDVQRARQSTPTIQQTDLDTVITLLAETVARVLHDLRQAHQSVIQAPWQRLLLARAGYEASHSPLRVRKNDLTTIRGIGPGIQQRLHSIGIYTYEQLAASTPQHIAVALGNLAHLIEPHAWIADARALLDKQDQPDPS